MAKCVENRNGYYGIATYDKNGNEKSYVPVGKLITLKSILLNLETNEATWYLSFVYKGKACTHELERGDITDKNNLKKLIAKGADIKPNNTNVAIESLLLQEDNAVMLNVFYNVGWIKIPTSTGDCFYYRHNTLIGNEGNYRGKMMLKPQGTFEGWKRMIQNEVLGRPALETIVTVSLSAVVNGLISPYTTHENPIVHICAPSGTGKSTLGIVACSVFGEPFEGTKRIYSQKGESKEVTSVFGSWNATENALITSNKGNQGVCVILNELGKNPSKDLTSIVYGLSDGVDKNRLNENYDGFVGENFCTTILSIGETSLLQRCKAQEWGVKIRVLEIDTPLTESAEHARRLKEQSRDNNGWAAPILANYIVNKGGKDYVLKKYRAILKTLTDHVTDSQKIRFIEKFTALFVTTAVLANEALGINFSPKSIIAFCGLCWQQKKEEQGEVDKSYTDILEYLKIHDSYFYKNNNPEYTPKESWGRIAHPMIVQNNKILVSEYIVRSNKLKEILTGLNYNNSATYLKKWRERGVLDSETGKLLNRRVVVPGSTTKESVYVVQEWVDNPTSKIIKKRVINNAKNANP